MSASTGNTVPEIERTEHRDYNGIQAKAVVPYSFDGTSLTPAGALVNGPYDTVNVTYPTSSSEVYVFSLSGVTTATVTVTYSDSTKANLTSVVRT